MSRKGAPYADIRVKKSKKLKANWFVKYLPDQKRSLPVLTPQGKPFIEPFHHWQFDLPTSDHPTCSHFSCGRTLTLRESLFSDKCLDHNPANYYPSYIQPSRTL